MTDRIAEVRFPARGIDQSQELSGQAPLTTPRGVNVQVFEPSTDRGRGGSRPGLSKLPPGLLPGGSALVQHLNTVVTADSANVPLGTEDPTNPVIDDPSSPGGPELWGTDPLYPDPVTGDPVSGATQGTRYPRSGTHAPKRRKYGSGYQPNPNQLTEAPPPASPRGCFQGAIEILVTKPAPDPYGWTGQRPAFSGLGCMAFAPPTVPAPTTATIVPRGTADAVLGTPAAMTILEYVKVWLAHYVGSDSYGVVTQDVITDPALVTSGGCSGSGACSASPPSYVPTLSAVGTTIHAA